MRLLAVVAVGMEEEEEEEEEGSRRDPFDLVDSLKRTMDPSCPLQVMMACKMV